MTDTPMVPCPFDPDLPADECCGTRATDCCPGRKAECAVTIVRTPDDVLAYCDTGHGCNVYGDRTNG